MTTAERDLERWLEKVLHYHGLQLVECGGGLYRVTDSGGLRVTDRMTLQEVREWTEEH